MKEVDKICNDLNKMWSELSTIEKENVELCVNPPYVYLDRVRTCLTEEIAVGSQNVFDALGPNGGNTGTITAKMIRAVGSEWVLLGHSDRRNNLGETNGLIAEKVEETLASGLGVILTIGELPAQRRWGRTLSVLKKQLGMAMKGIKSNEWHKAVIAYEPVWAVGDGTTPCSPEEAQRINEELRKYITEKVGLDAAEACRLTYTGSVNEKNAADYAPLVDVDGFVIGRAGLDTAKLKSIIQTMARDGRSSPMNAQDEL